MRPELYQVINKPSSILRLLQTKDYSSEHVRERIEMVERLTRSRSGPQQLSTAMITDECARARRGGMTAVLPRVRLLLNKGTPVNSQK